jgi:hypothetical protein
MPELPQCPAPIPLVPDAGRNGGIGNRRRAGIRKPLPDAQAIRALRVPEIAPPYDDIAVNVRTARTGRERPATVTAITLPARTGQPRPVAAATWPGQFAQILAETLAGYRPQRQLVPWTSEQARRRISQLGPMLAGAAGAAGPRRPKVRRVVVSSPAGDVLEMTIIVDLGSRIRAVAVRLERPGRRGAAGRWQCTDVEAA